MIVIVVSMVTIEDALWHSYVLKFIIRFIPSRYHTPACIGAARQIHTYKHTYTHTHTHTPSLTSMMPDGTRMCGSVVENRHRLASDPHSFADSKYCLHVHTSHPII